ncbi:MAG: endonuclease Q family protein [bacterium]|nr:endonuclease Q family protein [bacterium]
MNIVNLVRWGQLKGINVIGTGDFTHPRWFEELKEKLEPSEPGLYKLKSEFEEAIQAQVPQKCQQPMRFILSVEISCIYKKNDRVRKMHCLLFAPSFKVAEKINHELSKIGNIKSDGRPIIGLDAKKLFQLALNASPDCMFIPAHIWTPWFAVFGSKSGFDSLKEAFDELAPKITALETGLSSDPAMNWRVSNNDKYALVSNSDAHSPGKLGREANVFNTELSYFAIKNALEKNDLKTFESTIEFFPQEGKYHLDGHRACNLRMEPAETKKLNAVCPKCHKKLTIGTLHRISDIADRKPGIKPKNSRPYKSIIPLPELISEIKNVGVNSKTVQKYYHDTLNGLGNEFYILLKAPIAEITKCSGKELANTIDKMRKEDVYIDPGYDGEFGTIAVSNKKKAKKSK